MKTVMKLAVLTMTGAVAWIQCQGAMAQSSPLTASQARQALLPYVQAPDTTLGPEPAVTSTDSSTGHTEYEFHGDCHGGGATSYRIDASSGDKDINYYGKSTWDHQAGDAPPLLSSAQLLQAATAFASAHLPSYSACTLGSNNGGRAPSVADLGSYFVSFGALAASGAELPMGCQLEVEEDTGYVFSYHELNTPVSINTVPAISQAQAISIGQNWIAQNLTTDSTAQQLMDSSNLGGDPSVELQVAVDPSMNETLTYLVKYVACPLTIDAQTSAVISQDSWMGMGGFHGSPKLTPANREALVDIRTDRGVRLSQQGFQAILTRGQTYVWAGYLSLAGARYDRTSRRVRITRGERGIDLPLRSRAAASPPAAWLRKNRLYVPVAALRSLGCRVDEKDAVVLYADAAAPSPGSEDPHAGPTQPPLILSH